MYTPATAPSPPLAQSPAPSPHAPQGDPASLGVFRAGKNYFTDSGHVAWRRHPVGSLWPASCFWGFVFVSVPHPPRKPARIEESPAAPPPPRVVAGQRPRWTKQGQIRPRFTSKGPRKRSRSHGQGPGRREAGAKEPVVRRRVRPSADGTGFIQVFVENSAIMLPPWAFPISLGTQGGRSRRPTCCSCRSPTPSGRLGFSEAVVTCVTGPQSPHRTRRRQRAGKSP